MTKKLYIGLGILFTISISIFVFNAIYQGSVPKIVEEINNSSIGAILTAIITVLLLSQQSSSEEVKERNVRVFEEKSERFNTFINKLWDIWDDRVVSLEELNELIKLVSKDIVLYTKPETVDKILSHLIEIAEQAKPDKSNNKDAEATKLIQKNIFDIINELAKEIGLGGEIRPEIRTKLNLLENKVVPFLIQKDFKKNYIENFKQTIEQNEDIDFTSMEYKNKYLWCRVKDSNVYFRVGPMERDTTQNIQFAFYVEFWGNRNFQKYRDASKGFRKDFLGGANWWMSGNDFINFNNYEQVEKMHYELTENSENKIAQKVVELYRTWRLQGKNIEEIIEECTNSK
ncbi:hypothetical protein MHJ94_05780 [Chryseobacterium taklimakanense]|uniref:hypothetical protein n=1 Tax=Chryseobacterium taklimakanense TaxID=536441 RepID=UPI001EF74E93|nr:hypothetical protein [Chryseobacterium taklimakanense]MCG7280805.1 hypothetical protein [Chryseobacterium taklimakanense]